MQAPIYGEGLIGGGGRGGNIKILLSLITCFVPNLLKFTFAPPPLYNNRGSKKLGDEKHLVLFFFKRNQM